MDFSEFSPTGQNGGKPLTHAEKRHLARLRKEADSIAKWREKEHREREIPQAEQQLEDQLSQIDETA